MPEVPLFSIDIMQFRTPDIGSLNCLFVASRKRFARNMSFVRHPPLSPDTHTVDDAMRPDTRLACFEKCRVMCHCQYAELVLRSQGKGLASLTIPFEIEAQDLSHISDLLITPSLEFLTIDNYYCDILTTNSRHQISKQATSTYIHKISRR
jgi:hypothetical protein